MLLTQVYVPKQVRINAPDPLDVAELKKRSRMSSYTDEEDEEGGFEPPPRTTKRRKKPKTEDAKAEQQDTEIIDIGDGEEPLPTEGPQPHQLKFYKGEVKEVVDLAIFFFRLYLLNVNAYPDAEDLITWARNAYVAACKSYYGSKYKRMLAVKGNSLSF